MSFRNYRESSVVAYINASTNALYKLPKGPELGKRTLEQNGKPQVERLVFLLFFFFAARLT